MKKSRLLILGLIVLMLIGGLAVASCDLITSSLKGECIKGLNTGECNRQAENCAFECGGAEGNTYPCSSVCK